ncbi:MAG TPA: hypothetical protein EYP05_02775 [Piscirickettsiaceae bacterium]|nr:hypothetical protein [Piscirickettsiaceae bacterium]HIQ41001.1 hypothetical protein [Sulfurivirga caldicuralii]
MGDQLEQIQTDYIPVEDRILLKLRSGNQLYRLWLTRRYVGLLLPVLQGVHPQTGERFSDPPAVDPQLDEQFTPQKEAPLEQQAETVRLEYPLGEEPVLLTEISFQAPSSQHAQGQLVLKPQRGEGIVLPFSPTMNHLLLKLLLQTLKNTDWLQPLQTDYYTEAVLSGSTALQ